jgi:hypothetical protein
MALWTVPAALHAITYGILSYEEGGSSILLPS